MSAELHTQLDEALRTYMRAAGMEPGDVIVSWLAIAGIRRADGGGTVLFEASDDCPPVWQLRGLLTETLGNLDRDQLYIELGTWPDE